MADPKALRDVPFFADLTDNELADIAPIVNPKSFKIGETVFSESESGKSIYILKKGEVKACKTQPNGELLTLTLMKDGDIFGEMSFLDGRPRSATIVAISDLDTYTMEKDDFETLVEKHPRAVYKVLKNIIFTIHAIVKGMNTRYMEMMTYMWGRKRG